MCGILVTFSKISTLKIIENFSDLKVSQRGPDAYHLSQRGPDAYHSLDFEIPIPASNSGKVDIGEHEVKLDIVGEHKVIHAQFNGWVLHLRGKTPQPQPIIRQPGSSCNQPSDLVLFNGELYQYDMQDIDDDVNDTQFLSSKLFGAASTEADILSVISKMRGEWALCFFVASTNTLYFGRDFFGRRSLLYHLDQDQFLITSVSDGQSDYWTELPCAGLFKVVLDSSDPFEMIPLHWNSDITSPLHFSINSSLPKQLDPVVGDGTNLPISCLTRPQMEARDLLLERLKSSVKRRVSSIPPANEGDARLGILFSGGLDCMVLAALATECIPLDEPIDLMNVSFENPRSLKARAKENALSNQDTLLDSYLTPDRKTGLLGFKELQTRFPTREWRFIQINVPYQDAMEKQQHVLDLMNPLHTVMDLSIAIAFWFASRGIGQLYKTQNDEEYKSEAKVLLSGLGADEQLGGYSRHRKAFEQVPEPNQEPNPWSRLVAEISFDVGRISLRNLGRDDRIISDHGKEVRFPYLDENIVEFLSPLPIHIKTDPRYHRSVGDKMLLRLVAFELGLGRASCEAKRAVQFGARTAKMEFSRQKGHEDIKGR